MWSFTPEEKEYSKIQSEALRWKTLSIQIDQEKKDLQEQVDKLRQELMTIKATQAQDSFEKHRLELDVQGHAISSQRLKHKLKQVEKDNDSLQIHLDNAKNTIQQSRESYFYENAQSIKLRNKILSMKNDYKRLNDTHTKTMEELNRRPTQEAYDRVKDELEHLKQVNRDQFRRLHLANELLKQNMETLRQSDQNIEGSTNADYNSDTFSKVPNENIIVNHFNSGMSMDLSNQTNNVGYEVDSDGDILWE